MSKPAWKKFEEDVQSYFESRMYDEPIVYHRFYDTYSAESLLPSQPGDHLIKTPEHTILLETKHSEVHPSLRSCFGGMVGDSQIAHMRVWMRAGAIGLFLFKGTEGLELWEGGHCAYCRLNQKRLNPAHRIKTRFGVPITPTVLKEFFSIVYLSFPDTEMKWRIL